MPIHHRSAWDACARPRYHILGNHDMDSGFSREQTASFIGMPAQHYTFGGGAFQGVVLNGNDPGWRAGGYRP